MATSVGKTHFTEYPEGGDRHGACQSVLLPGQVCYHLDLSYHQLVLHQQVSEQLVPLSVRYRLRAEQTGQHRRTGTRTGPGGRLRETQRLQDAVPAWGETNRHQT